MKKIILSAIAGLTFMAASAQQDSVYTTTISLAEPKVYDKDEPYKIKPWLDIPVAAIGTGWTLYGFSHIYGRDQTSESKILALNKDDINGFDRSTFDNYSIKAKDLSDKFFYGSMPAPLVLLFDKEIRKDGLKVGLLYLEAMAVTGTLYTASAMIANRYRPYAYNPEVDLGTRTRGGARNSFFAGHVALVGTSTFFMAKVYTDYHPEMKNKWILFGLAGAATGTTGYLRMRAGQHFPSDVIVGTVVGTLSGILIPHFHKNKDIRANRLTLQPYFGFGNQTGVAATWRINK